MRTIKFHTMTAFKRETSATKSSSCTDKRKSEVRVRFLGRSGAGSSPTARIVSGEDGKYVIQAEVFGKD